MIEKNRGGKIVMMNSKININWRQVNKESIELNSPFAIYYGEFKEKILPRYSRSVELKMFQAEIVYAINKFLCLTSKMLERYLKVKGYGSIEQKSIQKELSFMSDNGYLCKYQFKNPDGMFSSGKFYTIGRKGAAFIYTTILQRANKLGYIDQCDATQVKRLLASNQGLIAMMELKIIKDEEISVSKMITDEGFHLIDNKYLFRATGYVENSEDIIFIEPVRNEVNFEEIIFKKLKRIEKTLGREKCNVHKEKNIRIVILAESLAKMEYLMNIIDESKYRNIHSFYYSFDGLMYTDCEKKFYVKSRDLELAQRLIAV